MDQKKEFKYKGLPFMFARLKPGKSQFPSKIEKFVVVIGQHDYPHANTAWMNDPRLPADTTLRPDIDIEMGEGETFFEFDAETEMIQFVSSWYHKNYPMNVETK